MQEGDVIIVRWADDFVVGFQYRDHAERFKDNWARGCEGWRWNFIRRKRGCSGSDDLPAGTVSAWMEKVNQPPSTSWDLPTIVE